MWDWTRAIVAPLATEAFAKSMRTQREAYETATGASLDGRRRPLGGRRRRRAGGSSRPTTPGRAPSTTGPPSRSRPSSTSSSPTPPTPGPGCWRRTGGACCYRLRIDLVVVDDDGRYWLMEHRLRRDGFAGPARPPPRRRRPHPVVGLGAGLPGHRGRHHPQRAAHARPRASRAGGRAPTGPATSRSSTSGPARCSARTASGSAARKIPRARAEIEGAGHRVAEQSRLMTRPTWSVTRHRGCRPVSPASSGRRAWHEWRGTADAALPEGYRAAPQRDFEEGRLGSVWGFVPHRPDHTQVRDSSPKTGEQP